MLVARLLRLGEVGGKKRAQNSLARNASAGSSIKLPSIAAAYASREHCGGASNRDNTQRRPNRLRNHQGAVFVT